MTEQELFDTAARHLLEQGKPSGKMDAVRFKCLYSGSGCALAPFLTEEQKKEWDEIGAIGDIPHSLIPDDLEPHLEFLDALQDAHDTPAMETRGEPTIWLSRWRERMKQIADGYRLNASILD